MLYNLSDVFTTEGKVDNISVSLEMENFETGMGVYPILEKSPVALKFTNIGKNQIRVEGNMNVAFGAVCDRCVEETTVKLELTFDRTVSPNTEDTDLDEADDLAFIEGFQIDIEAFVYNEIIVNWPLKILCKEDCKGVCPVCGQNLNEKECGCDTFVPDPRMAVLKDIFCANKEV